MKKLFRQLPLILLLLLQASFLLARLLEKLTVLPVLLFVLALLLLVGMAYSQMPRHHHKHLRRDFWAVAFVVGGALLTYALSTRLALGSVIAAGTTGTLASFFPWLQKKSAVLREVPAAAYCGAFVGMSSPQVAGGPVFILCASLVAGLLLVFSKNIFHGVGGKLGTIAFGGVALTYLLIFLLFR